jgi:hypothetical protein
MPVISRPLLIVLALAVVALLGFYATQGSRDSVGEDAPVEIASPPPSPDRAPEVADAPVAAVKPDPAPPAKSARKREGTAKRSADPAARARARERAERRGMPLAVARALDARRTVVLLFRGNASADDRATARAVAALRGQRGVAVFSDRIGRLGRYRAVVGELGIAQAPAVVIVDRDRSARVIEGYVDPVTLAQDVADVR